MWLTFLTQQLQQQCRIGHDVKLIQSERSLVIETIVAKHDRFKRGDVNSLEDGEQRDSYRDSSLQEVEF